MKGTTLSNPEAESLEAGNERVWKRNHILILEYVRENSPCTVLEIHNGLKVPGSTSRLHRHIIKQHLEALEKEGQVYRDSEHASRWRFGVRPSIVENNSSEEARNKPPKQHDFSDIRFLKEALENGKYGWFFRRTYNPQDQLIASLDVETYDEKAPHDRKFVDESGRRIGCMYVIADGDWDRLKAHPVTRLKDAFLFRYPYFLDKLISEAVRKKYLDLECFTDKGELRNISDADIRGLKKLAFGDIEKFIVAFSIYPDALFSWLRVTPEGREALIEASKSLDVKTEIEKRKSYEEIGNSLTQKMKSQDQANINAKRRSGHE